ncbi:MAG: ECF transporter S component [Clostridiales bacterium]|jgi:uncharacterized membrane protein|nr:ECF transporter S component [Clostridiales bacterium]
MNPTTKKIAYTGIFTALIAALTMLSIPLPGGGYVHVGDSVIFLAATLLPTGYAVIAAGIGSMVADLVLAPQYAVATLLIKALMALIVSLVMKRAKRRENIGNELKQTDVKRNENNRLLYAAAAFLAASLLMQVWYYVYELFLNDFHIESAFLHVILGFMQTVFSVPLGILLTKYVKKSYLKL